MSLKDIKIPADASDQQTTDAKSAVPPIEFSVSVGASSNILTIQDRQGVQNRLPTASYRTYFLPREYAPPSIGSTSTVAGPNTLKTAIRAAGQRVADLVADTSAPGFGSLLTVQDPIHFGQQGYYYCVAVNRAGVEAPVEHIVSTDDLGTASDTSGGGSVGPPPVLVAITSINGDITPAQTLIPGTNITITDLGAGNHIIDATAAGVFTMENSSTAVDGIATVFTFSTAVSANDPIFADGRLMDEAIGDYSRLGATVTFALAPISTVKRIF